MAAKNAVAAIPCLPFYDVITRVTLRVADRKFCFHCGRFDATPNDGAGTLVLARFRPKVARDALKGHTASFSLNCKAYHGLPLTTVNLSAGETHVGPNIFAVWSQVIPEYVSVLVDRVARVPEDVLLQSLDEDSPYVHNRTATEAIVRGHFAATGDTIVQSLQVSLICPLKRSRMTVPCRGARCLHMQCFDASAYLAMNESTLYPLWCCPVCSASVLLEDIRVDLFTLSVVTIVKDDCDAVKIFPNVTWEMAIEEEDHSIVVIEDSPGKSSSRASHNGSVIDLTGDPDDDC